MDNFVSSSLAGVRSNIYNRSHRDVPRQHNGDHVGLTISSRCILRFRCTPTEHADCIMAGAELCLRITWAPINQSMLRFQHCPLQPAHVRTAKPFTPPSCCSHGAGYLCSRSTCVYNRFRLRRFLSVYDFWRFLPRDAYAVCLLSVCLSHHTTLWLRDLDPHTSRLE